MILGDIGDMEIELLDHDMMSSKHIGSYVVSADTLLELKSCGNGSRELITVYVRRGNQIMMLTSFSTRA